MNYTVFYSWQSDLDNRFNRSFIQDVLGKAVKNISTNESYSLDAVVDRDTFGMPGSPSIVESITGKIAKSDVFVCDVSIVNAGSDGRQTPNPNVLFELGYASAVLGWERIIMIINTAFGGPEKLPFDLRGRRILQYYIDGTVENKTDEKQKLKQNLINNFSDALKYYSKGILGTSDKAIWWGTWRIDSKLKVRGGRLHISRVSSDAFFFNLNLFDGARAGDIAGKAQILTPHSAYARIKTIDNEDCEIIFRRRLEVGAWHIEIETGTNCSSFHGQGATFEGIYKHATEAVIYYGYLDEIDLNEIERITGKYLSIFLDNFQQIRHSRDNYGEGLTIINSGVKGLYTIMESIVILNDIGTVWCACLDPNTSKIVRYFTNSTSQIQPKDMQEWLSRFPNREILINLADVDSPSVARKDN